jgi:hypothetical protein
MTVDDVLYGLDTLWNSEALDPNARRAAKFAYHTLVAFKCARKLDGKMPAAELPEAAWATDESRDVPAH